MGITIKGGLREEKYSNHPIHAIHELLKSELTNCKSVITNKDQFLIHGRSLKLQTSQSVLDQKVIDIAVYTRIAYTRVG